MLFNLVTLNAGSSSVKFSLHSTDVAGSLTLVGHGEFERVDSSHSHAFTIFEQLQDWLKTRVPLEEITAIGHRVVHGGPRCRESIWVDEATLQYLDSCIPLAPNHLPSEIALMRQVHARLPHLPQVACFDTAFHADLPQVAATLPIAREVAGDEVRRYGFHGLSYAYLLSQLRTIAGEEAANGRVIMAHLGNGASMAALHQGKCIDTSMSLTPTAGLVMGTRTGDLDPGVLLYLQRERQLTLDQLDHLVTKQSGLLGISGTSSDMRDLLSRRSTDQRAAEAVAMFCYQAKKFIGAYIAALGGLDTLIFSGGIGEHSVEVRQEMCRDLDYLGIIIDNERNATNAGVISTDGSPVTVRVIATNEELMIAREVARMLTSRSLTEE